jgi:hypothetical protein
LDDNNLSLDFGRGFLFGIKGVIVDESGLRAHVSEMSDDVRRQIESIQIAISALAATPLGSIAFALAAIEVSQRTKQMQEVQS